MKTPRAPSRGGGISLNSQMTPMIDCIFQLMIFFLCTAGFVVPEAVLPTELPNQGAVSTVPALDYEDTEVVRIELAGDGEPLTILLNGNSIPSIAELLDRLEQVGQVSALVPVVLDVAKEVPIGPMIEVYDGAMSRGLRNIHFAVTRHDS